MTYTQMMIVEALSEEQARDVRNILDAHAANLENWQDFAGSARLSFVFDKMTMRYSEEGGRLIVFEAMWTTALAAHNYIATPQYRRLIIAIRHFIVGEPVHKFFRRCSANDFSLEAIREREAVK